MAGTTNHPEQNHQQRVSALVGLWAVSSNGESAQAVLKPSGELTLAEPCGLFRGAWRALPDATFVASLSLAPTGCVSDSIRNNYNDVSAAVPWVVRVSKFEVSTAGWRALDASGATLATFSPLPESDGGPLNQPAADPDSEQLASLDRTATALPHSVTPASRADIVGTWVSDVEPKPFITFRSDGSYIASDGCNDSGGRWAVSTGGAFVASAGASTLALCSSISLDADVARAARIGVDHGALVLFDATGHETRRVHRKG